MIHWQVVENACLHLSQIQKKTIRSKILSYEEPPQLYNFGEALLFWTADNIAVHTAMPQDTLRYVLEELRDRIVTFGITLGTAWQKQPPKNISAMKKLPVCKIGFLDKTLICIDGCDFFINTLTGDKETATDHWPLWTEALNLTTLFLRHQVNTVK